MHDYIVPRLWKGLSNINMFVLFGFREGRHSLALAFQLPRNYPWRLTWNIIMEVWFRSFSFLNGRFAGSMCEVPGVWTRGGASRSVFFGVLFTPKESRSKIVFESPTKNCIHDFDMSGSGFVSLETSTNKSLVAIFQKFLDESCRCLPVDNKISCIPTVTISTDICLWIHVLTIVSWLWIHICLWIHILTICLWRHIWLRLLATNPVAWGALHQEHKWSATYGRHGKCRAADFPTTKNLQRLVTRFGNAWCSSNPSFSLF